MLPDPHLECYLAQKSSCYVFVQVVVQRKIRFFSGCALLKKLGSVSLNLALGMPKSLSKHQLCGNENENVTSDML